MARPQLFNETEVLDKAVNLFWKKGYYDTSAQDLTEALGLNRSSIYNTFSDKRTLFIKALLRYRERDSKGLLQFLNEYKPHPDSIRALLEYVAYTALEPETLKGCFIVNTATELGYSDTEVQKIIQENVNEVVQAFQIFIEKMQTAGNLSREKEAKSLAIFLFHAMTALRVTTKVISERTFFKQNIDAIMLLFN